MNKGFTLIELLVVVLIIGILSAVALPQYEKAVRKARITEARTVLNALVKAEDLHILANGEPVWSSWDEFDITVPTETKDWIFEQEECVGGSAGIGCGVLATPKKESGYQIESWSVNYDGGPKENALAGKMFCAAGDANGHKICRGLGTVLASDPNRYEI